MGAAVPPYAIGTMAMFWVIQCMANMAQTAFSNDPPRHLYP
ncbi:MAG TPA: hypothetical protein VIS99_04575 [Terrimicrobiaceae bacterium]